MAVPATTDELLELVAKSGLVSSEKLAPWRNGHPGLPSVPRDAVKVLVGSGILTSFQGQNLLNGRWKGMVVGPYRVLGHLGSGGMGSVFLADHSLLDRKVALKVLGGDKVKDQSFLERFYREARAGAALDHPNIVRCHDVCREKDLHFIVFEYVAGKSLQQVIDALGGLPFQQAADYITQACHGLQHAYERGIIHRDIKPGNLILDKSGVIKVLDMGLARFDGPTVGKTITERLDAGAVLGTADYLSPEQAMNSHEVDIRTDIYSLGATLYALLTGIAPFSKITSLTEKLMAHQMRSPAPIQSVRPGVPTAMVEIVDAMMAKKPEDRPGSPEEVIELLRPLLEGSSLGNFAVGSTILRNRETLRELVKPPARPGLKTQVGPNSALPAPMPRLSRVPKKAWIVGGIALVAVVAGLALTLFPSSSPTPTPTKPNNVEVAKIDPSTPTEVAVGRQPPVVPKLAPPVAPEVVARVEPGTEVYRMNLSQSAPTRTTMVRQTVGAPLPQPRGFPTDWRFDILEPDTSAVLYIEDVQGRRRFGSRPQSGISSLTVRIPVGKLETDHRYELICTYQNNVCPTPVWIREGNLSKVALDTLPNSMGGMGNYRAVFMPRQSGETFLELGSANGEDVIFSDIRVIDLGRTDRVANFRKIYDLELPTTTVQPGRRKLRKSGAFDIVGNLPPNMYTSVYGDESTGEFAVEMDGSGLIMGIRNLDKLVSAQIGLKMPGGVENYRLDRTYRVVVEYRTTGGARGMVHCRGDGEKGWEHETRFVLPASETWNRIERDWKSDVATQPLLVFGLADKGENQWLYLRSVVIFESE